MKNKTTIIFGISLGIGFGIYSVLQYGVHTGGKPGGPGNWSSQFTSINLAPETSIPRKQLLRSPTAQKSVLNPKEDSSNLANSEIQEKDRQEAARKVAILDEILESKNDNDPRLDQEFKELSPAAKVALTQKYEALPPEARNDKGTVVFLLGRSLSTEADLGFMKQVLNEPSCLSLTDCSQPEARPQSHSDLGITVTLDYPKITALKSLENYILRNPKSTLSEKASELIRQSIQFGSPTVRRIASSVLLRINKNG
jgi:hypothetical protein